MTAPIELADVLANQLDVVAGDMRALRLDVERLVDAKPPDPWLRVMAARLEGLFRDIDAAATTADRLASLVASLTVTEAAAI